MTALACASSSSSSQPSAPSVERGGAVTEGAAGVLGEAAQAMAGTANWAYRYTYRGTGSVQGGYEGVVRLHKGEAPGQARIVMTVEGQATPKAPRQRFELAVRGREVQRIDHVERRVHRGQLPANAHLMVMMYYGVLTQLFNPAPFAPELQSGGAKIEGTETIDGVVCDVVHASNNSFGGAEVWWYLGREDHLPRGQRWLVTTPGVDGEFRFEMHQLHTDPLDDEATSVRAPAEYAQIDEDERAVGVGASVPPVALTAATGGSVDLASLRGQVVVLDFWASWCLPCKQIMPVLDRIAAENAGVRFFAVSSWEAEAIDPVQLLQAWNIRYPVLLHGEAIADGFKIATLPAIVVIDRAGIVRLLENPPQPPLDALEARVREAVAAALAAD